MVLQKFPMTSRWERIADALHTNRTNWVNLASYLGASPASVGNWKQKGVPAKHFIGIDKFLKKPLGWTELGDDLIEPSMMKSPVLPAYTATPKPKAVWPFELVSQEDYESLPLPLKYQVQVRMQDEIIKALKHQSPPKDTTKAA